MRGKDAVGRREERRRRVSGQDEVEATITTCPQHVTDKGIFLERVWFARSMPGYRRAFKVVSRRAEALFIKGKTNVEARI